MSPDGIPAQRVIMSRVAACASNVDSDSLGYIWVLPFLAAGRQRAKGLPI